MCVGSNKIKGKTSKNTENLWTETKKSVSEEK